MNHLLNGATDFYLCNARSKCFVGYSLPKVLQIQLLNKNGKPLARREQSTGPSDERIARKLHPIFQAELFAELDQLLLKNPIDEMKRGLSTSRQKLTEGLHAYGQADVLVLNKIAEDQAWHAKCCS